MAVRALLLVLALLVAGCGSDDSDETEPEAVGTEIGLRDFVLQPPNAELDSPGPATFTVVNAGETTHGLAIEGVDARTADLEPGDRAELTVDLAEGEYVMYCPVGDHREMGMAGTIVVGS